MAMRNADTRTAAEQAAEPHCAYCGQRIDAAPTIERFGEWFCSDAHAEQFVEGVRAARIEVAARRDTTDACGSLPPAGQRTWKDYVKRNACWGAPLLLLLAIPLFWSGGALAAAGGSLLSLLAVLACPLGMYFMMRAMMPAHRDGPNAGHANSTRQESGKCQESGAEHGRA